MACIAAAGRGLRCRALGVPAGFPLAISDAAARNPIVGQLGGGYRL